MEHMRDPDNALKEMARVVKRVCAFVLPLEKEEHAKMNSAHAIACSTFTAWRRVIKPHWKILAAATLTNERGARLEAMALAMPRVK